MKSLISGIVVATVMLSGSLTGCSTEEDACRAYCQRAGECSSCGGDVDIDACVEECRELPTDAKKKLPDCYKGECENIFICSDIIGTDAPSPCKQ